MLLKRLFDIVCASVGLIILAPLLLLIAGLIKLSSPGAVFFRQQRIGLQNKPFAIFKFRTMVENAENIGPKITVGQDNRITSIGRFLRKSKLDELPQLIDVVRGTMSLVGPRPEVPEYVALYPAEIRKLVLSVRPGITDGASILMIDENDLLAKLAYAVKYVKTRTFWQDCMIILATMKKIFSR